MKRKSLDIEMGKLYLFLFLVVAIDIMSYVISDHSNYLSLWIRNLFHMFIG
jgi:hypothetical protein